MIRKVLVVAVAAGALFGCASQEQKKSIEKNNEGMRAMRAAQYDVAVQKFDEAVTLYRDNHTAHWNKGLAYNQLNNHAKAADAFEKAVQLAPKEEMYHLKLGVARYNVVLADAKQKYANVAGIKVEEVDPTIELTMPLHGFPIDPALQELQTAVQLEKGLYSAHYYIGRIHRHMGKWKEAADAFTAAIEANVRYPNPYIALGSLYRLWGYRDEAIRVLTQGKEYVPKSEKLYSELLFTLGMAYVDGKDHAKAIEEFSEALRLDKNHQKARFQRALAYFQVKDYKKSKDDLEAFQKNAKDEYMKSVAQKLLLDIMAAQN